MIHGSERRGAHRCTEIATPKTATAIHGAIGPRRSGLLAEVEIGNADQSARGHDAGAEQNQLHRTGCQPARARDHVTRGQFEHRRGEEGAGQEDHERG